MTGPHASRPAAGRDEAVCGQSPCRVCREPSLAVFADLAGQRYWRCETCEAVLLDEACLPAPVDERAYYELHENDEHDERYRRFVSRLADPLLERLEAGREGLDYGCGPGPALAAVLREHGHAVALYDPYFCKDAGALERTYDFIVCCEVAEHFHRPADEFDRLDSLLRPGGWLGLMTCFRTEDRLFAGWQYRHDPTHVVFYREQTLRFVARRRGWSCDVPRKDVAIMRKPTGHA